VFAFGFIFHETEEEEEEAGALSRKVVCSISFF